MQTRAFSRLQRKVLAQRRSGASWREVAKRCGIVTADGRPNPGMAKHIADGYEPKSRALRVRVGLSKSRPTGEIRRVMVSDLTPDQARWAFQNRMVME